MAYGPAVNLIRELAAACTAAGVDDPFAKGGIGTLLLAHHLGHHLIPGDKGPDARDSADQAYEYKVSTTDQFDFNFGPRQRKNDRTPEQTIRRHFEGIVGTFLGVRVGARITAVAYRPTEALLPHLIGHFESTRGGQLTKNMKFATFLRIEGAKLTHLSPPLMVAIVVDGRTFQLHPHDQARADHVRKQAATEEQALEQCLQMSAERDARRLNLVRSVEARSAREQEDYYLCETATGACVALFTTWYRGGTTGIDLVYVVPGSRRTGIAWTTCCFLIDHGRQHGLGSVDLDPRTGEMQDLLRKLQAVPRFKDLAWSHRL